MTHNLNEKNSQIAESNSFENLLLSGIWFRISAISIWVSKNRKWPYFAAYQICNLCSQPRQTLCLPVLFSEIIGGNRGYTVGIAVAIGCVCILQNPFSIWSLFMCAKLPQQSSGNNFDK